MFVTIITDCKNDNERGRQETRFASLGLGPTCVVGVGNGLDQDTTLEASGNLVDMLDASGGEKGIIVVNVAPRGEVKEDGENGSSFAYFYFKNTLVISTIKGCCLSLVKKLKITKSVNLLNLKSALSYAVAKKLIDKDVSSRIVKSQFRSFDFVPRVAKWLLEGNKIPSKKISLEKISSIPSCIWHIDTFGNAKLTIHSKEFDFKPSQKIDTNVGLLTFYNRLKDVPEKSTGLYIGSSGLDNTRFLEIAAQNVPGSAEKKLGLIIGQKININKN